MMDSKVNINRSIVEERIAAKLGIPKESLSRHPLGPVLLKNVMERGKIITADNGGLVHGEETPEQREAREKAELRNKTIADRSYTAASDPASLVVKPKVAKITDAPIDPLTGLPIKETPEERTTRLAKQEVATGTGSLDTIDPLTGLRKKDPTASAKTGSGPIDPKTGLPTVAYTADIPDTVDTKKAVTTTTRGPIKETLAGVSREYKTVDPKDAGFIPREKIPETSPGEPIVKFAPADDNSVNIKKLFPDWQPETGGPDPLTGEVPGEDPLTAEQYAKIALSLAVGLDGQGNSLPKVPLLDENGNPTGKNERGYDPRFDANGNGVITPHDAKAILGGRKDDGTEFKVMPRYETFHNPTTGERVVVSVLLRYTAPEGWGKGNPEGFFIEGGVKAATGTVSDDAQATGQTSTISSGALAKAFDADKDFVDDIISGKRTVTTDEIAEAAKRSRTPFAQILKMIDVAKAKAAKFVGPTPEANPVIDYRELVADAASRGVSPE